MSSQSQEGMEENNVEIEIEGNELLDQDFVSIALPVIGFFLAEQRFMTNTSSTAMSVLRAIVMPGFAIHQI